MTKASDTAIAGFAQGAGLTGTSVAIAVAVALAESGGETTNHNPVPPDDSYGLWQINMIGNLGPERRKLFGITDNTQLYDPVINAKAMAIISHGGSDWSQWTTYTSGKYRMFMARGSAAAANPGSAVTVGTTTVSSGGLGGLEAFFTNLSNPSVWRRILITLGGLVLLIFAIMHGTGDNKVSDTTKSLVKAGVKAAKVAAVA